MKIIDWLRNASAEERPSIIENIYLKNRDFFACNYPDIDLLLDQYDCPYHIDITDKFLNIVHSSTGNVCHPVNGLDALAEALSDPGNVAWTELTCFSNRIPSDRFMHGRLLSLLHDRLLGRLSDRQKQVACEHERFVPPALKETYCSAVIFLGIFHGLHIDSFLARCDTNRIMFIEPEPDRFMVSCYFLDYSEIQDRFGKIILCLGTEGHDDLFKDFFAWHNVTAQVWTRLLPAYVSPAMAPLVNQLAHFQRLHLENVRPFDPDLEGINNTFRKLSLHLPLLSDKMQLSKRSAIAVVGSGPSLENDIEWLKNNQDRVIIFAVHSAVRILSNHGITPDFQFTIDIHLDRSTIENLQLLSYRPLISTAKINKEWFEIVDHLYLVESDVRASAVKFNYYVKNIYPTTGNLALGLACFAKPSKVFLIGLDFGFQSYGKRHADGGIYVQENNTDLYKKGDRDEGSRSNKNFTVKANFDSTGHIVTTTYLSAARQAAEAAFAESPAIKIFNLSDGALVKGAEPRRSSTLQLEEYEEKEYDIKTLKGAFKPAKEGLNWKYYTVSGQNLIETVKSIIDDFIRMEEFELKGFSSQVDKLFVTIVQQMREIDGGVRVEVYLKFLLDVIALFYRTLLIAEDEEERKHIYCKGLDDVKSVVKQIYWPNSTSS